MTFESIFLELKKQTKLSKEELNEKIVKKQKELSGLVSLEGAAQLVVKELGINLFGKKRLEIKDIGLDMKNISFVGRVFQISPIREFKKQNGISGKVVNLLVGDNSDYVRVTLWNEQVKLVEESIKLGDAIQINNGFAKESIFGNVEINLGKYGKINCVDSADLPSLNELIKKFLSNSSEKTQIKNLKSGNLEISGNVINVFKSKFFFDTCPICSSSVANSKCNEHGDITPNPELVISFLLDDGTADLRVVFFRELAEKLLGTDAQTIKNLDLENRYNFIKDKLLGRELAVAGKVRKNIRFDNFEMMVNNFKDLNALDESKKLIEGIELSIGG